MLEWLVAWPTPAWILRGLAPGVRSIDSAGRPGLVRGARRLRRSQRRRRGRNAPVSQSIEHGLVDARAHLVTLVRPGHVAHDHVDAIPGRADADRGSGRESLQLLRLGHALPL